jgi:uncharacterized protein
MRWQRGRRSGNVIDTRGAGMRLGGGLGLGGVAVVIVLSLLFGQNPLELLGLVSQMSGSVTEQQSAPIADEESDFVRAILGETEDVWGAVFQRAGSSYELPRVVLFSGAVRSACGGATSATGPFYCPADHRVYLDLSFFKQMESRLGGGGDFAYAYVIAHEVGHHVQTLQGVSERVNRARMRGQNIEGAGGLLVRQELQADCYAGVWANHGQQRHQWLEEGDVEEALNTATAIGDDRLQKQSQGTVVPDAFTHGTSAQRVKWFKTGLESGDPARCDTFSAATL